MRIPLFFKSSIIKASLCLSLLGFVFIQPPKAHAGFFSDLVTKVFGAETPAVASEVVHNSQTLPLLESSINPDVIASSKDTTSILTGPTDAISVDNSIPIGPGSDIENNVSSEKITIYIVKKGDTLKSIAKALKVATDTIIYSNTDMKKSELTKVDQALVILPMKEVIKAKALAQAKVLVQKKIEKAVADTNDQVDATPQDDNVVLNINQPVIAQATQVASNITPTVAMAPQSVNENLDIGQPTGTIVGGYIWPFPSGIGRVSQGLHADNAYDFAAPTGTPIYAIQSGTIFIAHPTGYNGGYGKYVVMNFTDGRQAIFGHMSKVVVQEGDVVKQGDIIGYVGSTGKSTGSHTHIGFHGDLGNPYLGLKVNSTSVGSSD